MWRDFCIAIGNTNRYDQLLKNSTKRLVAYLLLLVLVTGILSFAVPMAVFSYQFLKQFPTEFPDFSLSQKGFVVEKTIEYDQKPVLLRATNQEPVSAEGLEEYISAILLDKEKAILKNGTEIMEISFAELGPDFLFEKKDIGMLKPFFVLAFVVAGIMILIISAVSMLFYSVIVAAIGNMMNATQKNRLQFSQLFRLALYARTLPLLLGSVLGLFGIYFFPWLGVVVSCAMMWFSLKAMNQDEPTQTVE